MVVLKYFQDCTAAAWLPTRVPTLVMALGNLALKYSKYPVMAPAL